MTHKSYSDAIPIFESWTLSKDPANIGEHLKDYISESNHAGWDGFTERDLSAIGKFLNDFMLYYEHA